MPDTRTYIKVHDGMPDHPKVLALSDRAFRLLMESWCWCSRHLTDGHINKGAWDKFSTRAARRELIDAGLVEETDTGVAMHDYLEHQRSAAEVLELRKVRQEAGKRGGKAKANGLANARANGKQTSSKSLPVSETDTDTESDTENQDQKHTPSDDGFDEFWQQYPTRVNSGSKGSKKNAHNLWKKLPQEKRSRAIASLPIYAKAKNGYPKDAERYLRGEEWDGLENVVSIPESEYQWL